MPEAVKIIPLCEPHLQGNEWTYVKECLDTGWISSVGRYVGQFEGLIAGYVGVKHAVACVNGTSALFLALKLAGIEPGDEVLMPTLAFIAPANAITYLNARPVFFDTDEYYNIDPDGVISFLKEETVRKGGRLYNKRSGRRIRALLPVHNYGNAANLTPLLDICAESGVEIIEDAAESLGSWYHTGEHTGTLGRLGCLSFNGNKIITTGGGGMIITNDSLLAEKARYLTSQAKDNPDKYIHHEIGFNLRLSNIHAAIGVAQIEQLPQFLDAKRAIFTGLESRLSSIRQLELVTSPDYARSNHWLNVARIEKAASISRDIVIEKLRAFGVQTRPVWYPIHLQRPYRECQAYNIKHALNAHKNSMCLPSGVGMMQKDIETIANAFEKILLPVSCSVNG